MTIGLGTIVLDCSSFSQVYLISWQLSNHAAYFSIHWAKTTSNIPSKEGTTSPAFTQLFNRTERLLPSRNSKWNRWLFPKSTTKISTHNLNHVSNLHPSLQAKKRDKRKRISNSQGNYFNSARIYFFSWLVPWMMMVTPKSSTKPPTVHQLCHICANWE